jgi:UDP-N-acetylglucosamine diphosphorylase/glucosamine-1-phosphate N-acetyltransferase
MASLLLIEKDITNNFYPLTLTRQFIDLRFGMLTIREKWERLAEKQDFPLTILSDTNDSLSPSKSMAANFIPPANLDLHNFFNSNSEPEALGFVKIDWIWNLTSNNSWAIEQDFRLMFRAGNNQHIPAQVKLHGSHPIHLGENINVENCFINTSDGPVYIADDVHVMDGAMLRGPLFIGEKSVIKMGATIYGGTSIGPGCTIGGEVKNSIFHGFSNKGHHGYIGDSYVGTWCNLGAGTSCSNLKNTVGKINIWDIESSSFRLGEKKAGIFLGDYVKTSINTSFNSGTVVGVCANIFEFAHLTDKFIPSFAWGGKTQKKYELEKLLEEISRWMEMKGQTLDNSSKEKIITLYLKSNKN